MAESTVGLTVALTVESMAVLKAGSMAAWSVLYWAAMTAGSLV